MELKVLLFGMCLFICSHPSGVLSVLLEMLSGSLQHSQLVLKLHTAFVFKPASPVHQEGLAQQFTGGAKFLHEFNSFEREAAHCLTAEQH